MKTPFSNTSVIAILCGSVLSSCVYYSNPVPDIPYRPRRQAPQTQAALPTPTPAPAAPALPTPAPAPAAAPAAAVQHKAAPATTDAWLTERPKSTPLPPVTHPAVQPAAHPTTPPKPKPAPTPTSPIADSSHITQMPLPKPTPAPVAVSTPTPAPAPTPTATPAPAPTPSPAEPKLVSNDGPIPVATRVPGDPLRVYNPLDPSKKIKVIDKNGNPQPSGKKLKVPGTNFFFYVP